MAGSLSVRRLRSWDEVARLCPPWNELLASSSSRTAFLTWEWLSSWWSAFGSSQELMLLACQDGDGNVVGAAPLYRARLGSPFSVPLRMLRLVGVGSGDSDNLDFVIRQGGEAAAVRACLDWLWDHPSEWDVLELTTVPAESSVVRALLADLDGRRARYARGEWVHLAIPLPGNWEAYHRALSKKMRWATSYSVRHLERLHHVRLRRCESEAELPSCLEALFRLHTARWGLRGEAGNFGLPQRRGFYADVARRFLAAGRLDFWLLDVDGRPAAVHFGFRYAGTHYHLDGGFDPAYRSLSVGLVLQALVVRQLIQDGIREYDFLGGDDAYKLRWGAERRSYLRLRCARPGSLGALYILGVRAAELGRAWVRARPTGGGWAVARGIYRRLRQPPEWGPLESR